MLTELPAPPAPDALPDEVRDYLRLRDYVWAQRANRQFAHSTLTGSAWASTLEPQTPPASVPRRPVDPVSDDLSLLESKLVVARVASAHMNSERVVRSAAIASALEREAAVREAAWAEARAERALRAVLLPAQQPQTPGRTPGRAPQLSKPPARTARTLSALDAEIRKLGDEYQALRSQLSQDPDNSELQVKLAQIGDERDALVQEYKDLKEQEEKKKEEARLAADAAAAKAARLRAEAEARAKDAAEKQAAAERAKRDLETIRRIEELERLAELQKSDAREKAGKTEAGKEKTFEQNLNGIRKLINETLMPKQVDEKWKERTKLIGAYRKTLIKANETKLSEVIQNFITKYPEAKLFVTKPKSKDYPKKTIDFATYEFLNKALHENTRVPDARVSRWSCLCWTDLSWWSLQLRFDFCQSTGGLEFTRTFFHNSTFRLSNLFMHGAFHGFWGLKLRRLMRVEMWVAAAAGGGWVWLVVERFLRAHPIGVRRDVYVDDGHLNST